jgi:hypothetical protein
MHHRLDLVAPGVRQEGREVAGEAVALPRCAVLSAGR